MTCRGRVELRQIEDRVGWQVRFSKRCSGIFKKAFEFSLLCDVEVALIVFSPTGKLCERHHASLVLASLPRSLMYPSIVSSSLWPWAPSSPSFSLSSAHATLPEPRCRLPTACRCPLHVLVAPVNPALVIVIDNALAGGLAKPSPSCRAASTLLASSLHHA